MKNRLAYLTQRHDFDEIIDVRTPLEYSIDAIPGAINLPVLSNEERILVGTRYRQAPFDATRLGAAWVAKNIAYHLETSLAERPAHWRPLIYCWRGGKRSAAMTEWLNLIGWKARQLEGGYKGYRRWVMAQLDVLPRHYRFLVVRGDTGSGKTRLLRAFSELGAQVLDLEALACHRGSVLGALPGQRQPTQKFFDSQFVAKLSQFDVEQPVLIEDESRRIGTIHLPLSLMQAMGTAECIEVHALLHDRIALLEEEYAHLFDDIPYFKQRLQRLIPLHSKARIQHWLTLLEAGEKHALFRELIIQHYDPAYRKSTRPLDQARRLVLRCIVQPDSPIKQQAHGWLKQLGIHAVPIK